MRRETSPGGNSFEIMPGLYAALEKEVATRRSEGLWEELIHRTRRLRGAI